MSREATRTTAGPYNESVLRPTTDARTPETEVQTVIERAMVVLGTRPEAIKTAPVVHALRARGVGTTVVSTGQHREMLAPMLELFGIEPDVDLDLQHPDQTAAEVVAGVLRGLPPVLAEHRPQAVLVQGDTATAFAAGFAAFLAGCDVGHVEAGLRTDDPRRPFPEEMNRRLITRLARWHFAPTARAAAALGAEGVPDTAIHTTGNTVVDALHWLRDERRDRIEADLARDLDGIDLEGRRLVAVTGHRRESFGEPMRRVCSALRRIADAHDDVTIVFPVHLNPRVQEAVRAVLSGHPRIHLLPPVGYPTMIGLLERAVAVVTDSGGIQEEAPGLGTPVLVTREVTERPEGVEAGFATLVGTDDDAIVRGFEAIGRRPAPASENPYGDGRAAARIVGVLGDVG
mgnify:FL=1